MKSTTVPALSCTMGEAMLTRLVTVLQAGFFCDAAEGESIAGLLATLPGFSDGYIVDRLQTIFLNGDAVDDLDLGFSGPAATLALSGAMPGLAGAIFRKNSPHAALRKKTADRNGVASNKTVRVRIKLFNAIAIERGPELLARGVRLNSADLTSFLALRPTLVEAMEGLHCDGIALSQAELWAIFDRQPEILLLVAAS